MARKIIIKGKPYWRKRCPDCGKMFNAKNTYMSRCTSCQRQHTKVMTRFGL